MAQTDDSLREASVLMAMQNGTATGRDQAARVITRMTWEERRQLHDAALELVIMVNRVSAGMQP
jgi:hypothetical protein